MSLSPNQFLRYKLDWFFISSTILVLTVSSVSAQSLSTREEMLDSRHDWVDDTHLAMGHLEKERALMMSESNGVPSIRAERMIELGMLTEAASLLSIQSHNTYELEIAQAKLHIKLHDYTSAEQIVNELLEQDSASRDGVLLRARLHIQSWQLEKALSVLKRLPGESFDVEAALLQGRISLLRRDYTSALEKAKEAQQRAPENSEAHLLEADVWFWQRDLTKAEPALIRALTLDPFNADARFAYGYAIWRRVDATQLSAMAAQWNLALSLDPFHYRTHWHFGNGHTNLTYADYAHPTDSTVQELLIPGDSLLARDALDEAIALTWKVERAFPESVLPAMMRGSAYFMAYDMDRSSRLDSAQHHFLSVLDRKKNYGPAHNGLAAVIKQRQIRQLAEFADLEAAIDAVPIRQDDGFFTVFPDVAGYPGQRVEKMVRHQLHKGIVYLPFLVRLQRTFTIPPLHVDLAEAMDAPYFRFATTFDNRQWMDIRGVGSGAAGIEYVERGAFLERNVVLHEYVHLFHGQILTDSDRRRIRELYFAAMAGGHILDYYSANNESEYLAQTYTAYFAPVKVHPLNHKAMNTASDLKTKDPELYTFIDQLVARQTAYLEGDTASMASNWAQVYVTLSEQARENRGPDAVDNEDENIHVASALLDTALTWDAAYLPVYLSYASLKQQEQHFDEAETWLDKAEAIDPSFAPIYRSRAELSKARHTPGTTTEASTLEDVETQYHKALSLETDLAERARLNEALREWYMAQSHHDRAIEFADEYATTGPTISTYLRDRRDEAWAFAASLKGEIGYPHEVHEHFAHLVSQKPQNYSLRAQYAGILRAMGKTVAAIDVLEESQHLLQSAGRPRTDFALALSEFYLQLADSTKAREALSPLSKNAPEHTQDALLHTRIVASMGYLDQADTLLQKIALPATPYDQADYYFTQGHLHSMRGQPDKAVKYYKTALSENPYHLDARLLLMKSYIHSGYKDRAITLSKEGDALPIPLGPQFKEQASDLIAQ